jgi:hypothetical protein
MSIKYRFTLGIFAGAFLGTLLEARRLFKHNNELIDKYNGLIDKYGLSMQRWSSQCEAVLYMLSVLEERDIDLTEFDLIALRNIVLPKQA